jgi:ATP/maltotriose-dependent transcriptional regulator MalT
VLAFLQCEYGLAQRRLESALKLYRDLGDERGAASALQVLGSIARERGGYEQAETYHRESLAIWQRLGEERDAARSLNYLGFVAWLRGEHDRATKLCNETLEIFRRLGDAEGTVWALINLGSAALYRGAERRARELLEESLELSRRTGFREGVGWSLNQLGVICYRRGDSARASEMLRESLIAHWDLGDRWRMASVLEALAEVACSQGHLERAARLFGAAEALREAIGAPVPPCERPERDRCVAAANAGMSEEAFSAARALGRAAKLQETVSYAREVPRERPKPTAAPGVLSARELEVLRLVAEGLTNPQVAERLYLSPRTVGQHLRSVYRKLEVPSRAAAVRRADELGLI